MKSEGTLITPVNNFKIPNSDNQLTDNYRRTH